VTDSAELTHLVLLKVADFIKKLPTDQLADLAAGEAKLELVPKGGRPAARSRAAAKPAVSADQVRADLYAINDRAAARQYVVDLGLTVPGYRSLAKELGVTVASKDTKDAIQQKLVQWTVGRRIDSDVISRPAPALV
jgi:hypothetical protein